MQVNFHLQPWYASELENKQRRPSPLKVLYEYEVCVQSF